MCNYGSVQSVSADQMVDSVRRGLATLCGLDGMTLLLSATGSMFDDWEVPAGARERIFKLAHETNTAAILCETRAETLDDASVRGYADIFDDREAGIGIGLESADSWILKYSVNKSLSLDDCRSGLTMLRRHGVLSTANVLLGPPFLSEAEAIDDAVEAARWAFAAGADQCVVFPAHVKSHTLVHWLWRRRMYSPPSLWSLVRVLSRLGPQLSPRVTISWYKDYYAAGTSADTDQDRAFVCSPTTCPECSERVMALLDIYRDTGDFSAIDELTAFDCECRRRWKEGLEAPVDEDLAERVARAYEVIGRGVLGAEWWLQYGDAVLQDVRDRERMPDAG